MMNTNITPPNDPKLPGNDLTSWTEGDMLVMSDEGHGEWLASDMWVEL